MKKNIIYIITVVAIALTSCFDDLDRFPANDTTSEVVYSTFDGTKEALAKIYGAYTLSGQVGPGGKPDIVGLREDQNADFLRNWFNHQETPTDEAHCRWNDAGIPELNYIKFTPHRLVHNRFIRQVHLTSDVRQRFSSKHRWKRLRRTTGRSQLLPRRSPFLEAFAYWVLIDNFGNPPFVTEKDDLGILPDQIQRADLFKYIEDELLDLANNQGVKRHAPTNTDEPTWAPSGRSWPASTSTPRFIPARPGGRKPSPTAKKVIDAGYDLHKNYEHLFLADNNVNNPEMILPIAYDGQSSRVNGGVSRS